jgi:LPXTG-motif cell wall-anchored protein
MRAIAAEGETAGCPVRRFSLTSDVSEQRRSSRTVDGEMLTPQANGRTLLPMSVSRDPQLAELTLTNTASSRPLPATGGGGIPPLVPLGAVVLIALGALLATRRTRRV